MQSRDAVLAASCTGSQTSRFDPGLKETTPSLPGYLDCGAFRPAALLADRCLSLSITLRINTASLSTCNS